MDFFKDRNLKFGVLLWLFLSIPFGISFYLINDMYQYQKYLLSEGELGFGTYRKVPSHPDSYALFLRDGREILSVYSKKIKNLELDKEYRLIYVSLGKLIVSVELYPFDKFFIFRSVRPYFIWLALMALAAFYAAGKLSK